MGSGGLWNNKKTNHVGEQSVFTKNILNNFKSPNLLFGTMATNCVLLLLWAKIKTTLQVPPLYLNVPKYQAFLAIRLPLLHIILKYSVKYIHKYHLKSVHRTWYTLTTIADMINNVLSIITYNWTMKGAANDELIELVYGFLQIHP